MHRILNLLIIIDLALLGWSLVWFHNFLYGEVTPESVRKAMDVGLFLLKFGLFQVLTLWFNVATLRNGVHILWLNRLIFGMAVVGSLITEDYELAIFTDFGEAFFVLFIHAMCIASIILPWINGWMLAETRGGVALTRALTYFALFLGIMKV